MTAEAPAVSSESLIGAGMAASAPGHLLDQDILRGLVAEREARAADLAKDRRAAGNLRDECRLAKTHFPHALTKRGIALERTHPPQRTGRELAERKQRGERRAAHERKDVFH